MPVSLYPLGKNPQYPLKRSPCGAQSLSGRFGEREREREREREISYPFRISNPSFSDVYPIA